MASSELSASLNYLTDAAHLLRTVAPETSAHLMSQRASLLLHHGMAPSETQRQHVCGACGHIMIPGQGTRITLESRRFVKKGKGNLSGKAKSANPPAGPVKVVSCGFCNRTTRISLPAPDRTARPKKSKATATKKPDAVETRQATVTTANASSKKRAKGRKAGLQALLSGQQQRKSASLSLADFGR